MRVSPVISGCGCGSAARSGAAGASRAAMQASAMTRRRDSGRIALASPPTCNGIPFTLSQALPAQILSVDWKNVGEKAWRERFRCGQSREPLTLTAKESQRVLILSREPLEEATMENTMGASAAPEKHSLKERALDELRHYIIITLYLWLLFAVFSLYKRMILQENGISVWGQTLAIVNALVFGKVILIAQALHLEAGLRKYPRIWIVLGNSALFTIVLVAFHILEDAIKAWFDGRPLATAVADFGGGTLAGFLSMGAIFFVALIPFFGVHEVARAVGGRALWDLFFSGRTQAFRLVED